MYPPSAFSHWQTTVNLIFVFLGAAQNSFTAPQGFRVIIFHLLGVHLIPLTLASDINVIHHDVELHQSTKSIWSMSLFFVVLLWVVLSYTCVCVRVRILILCDHEDAQAYPSLLWFRCCFTWDVRWGGLKRLCIRQTEFPHGSSVGCIACIFRLGRLSTAPTVQWS